MKSTGSESKTDENTTQGAESAESTDTSFTSTPTAQPPFSPPTFTFPPFGPFSPFNMQFPPPPFMAQGSGNGAHVPRFPLPFVSPFYPMAMPPQGFPPGMPPMMPGMPLPPWQRNIIPPQSSPSTAPPAGESTSNSSETSGRSSPQVVQEESIQSTQASVDTHDLPRNPSNEPENIGSQSSSQETSREGVRRRTHHRTPRQEGSVRTEPRSAEIPARTRNLTSDIALLAFATFVIGVILFLFLRRLHMMNMLPDII